MVERRDKGVKPGLAADKDAGGFGAPGKVKTAMRKAFRACAILLAATCLGGGALTAAISEADRAAATKTVEKMFGKQIGQAKLTLDKADDVKTAELLLQASGEGRTPLAVRAGLARTAMELVLPVGSDESSALAVQALRQWSTLAGLSRIERGKWLVNIRQTELRKARREQTKRITPGVIQAIVELAESYEADGDLDSAAAHVFRALAMARKAQLADLVSELTVTNMRVQRIRSFRRDLGAAEKQLAAAVAGKNHPLINKTVEKIGLLHLLRNGDPISSAEHLARAKHEWATPAADLRRRASGRRLSAAESLAAAEMLRGAAHRAEQGAKAPLLELLLDLCVELEATVPDDSDQAVRAEMLRRLAQGMLAKLPNSSLHVLRRALANLAAAPVFNPDGTVQLTYAFSSARELNDWTVTRGKWSAAKGTLAVAKGGGSVYHNLRFRADRPLHVSFAAAGPGSITSVLAFNDDLQNYLHNAHFCVGHRSGTLWYTGGLGGRRLIDRLASTTQPYRVQILHDGVGRFTYIINGRAVGKLQTNRPLIGGSFRLGFVLSPSRVASISKLTIRGAPPTKDPLAKADAKPPPRPPRPRPQRQRRPPRRRLPGR